MKRIEQLGIITLLTLTVSLLSMAGPDLGRAQQEGSAPRNFVDQNGDGLCDNGRDHDGDGIPNGQDPDYTCQNPQRGNGQMGFVDEDGDGINDRALDEDGDGIPNGLDPDYEPPKDGTGRKLRRGRGDDGSNNPGNGNSYRTRTKTASARKGGGR